VEPALGPKSVLSGSLQKRRVNTFPNIETTPSSPAMLGSYGLSPLSRNFSKDHGGPNSFGLGSYNRDEKPIFQTFAASVGAVAAADKEAEMQVVADYMQSVNRENGPQEGNDDEYGADEFEENGESGDEKSVSSDSSDEGPATKQPMRPPVHDPAAMTKAAAMRTFSANVPIGTKVSASGPSLTTGSASSVYFNSSPRTSMSSGPPPGPSLSVLASISGVGGHPSSSMSPTNSARSSSPYATSYNISNSGVTAPSPPPASPGPGSLSAKGIQCTHCLRRMPQIDILMHTKTCELRPEQCKFGCGAKITYCKLDQHYETCPLRHQENARMAASVRAEAVAAKEIYETTKDVYGMTKTAEAKSRPPYPSGQHTALGAKKIPSPVKPDIVSSSSSSSSGLSYGGSRSAAPEVEDDDEEELASSSESLSLSKDEPSNIEATDATSKLSYLKPLPAKLQPLNRGSHSRSSKLSNSNDLESSFESSSESMDALWAMADDLDDKSAEGKVKPRRKKTPSGLSILQQEAALSISSSRKAVNALNSPESEGPETEDVAVSSFLQPKHRNRLTDKIQRGIGGYSADKKQANDEDN
jgi:hypothetical protein